MLTGSPLSWCRLLISPVVKGVCNQIILENLLINLYEILCIAVQLSHYPSNFGPGDISKGIQSHWTLRLKYPLQKRGGWENPFPRGRITSPIPKGARVRSNRNRSHISLLNLCSNWNGDNFFGHRRCRCSFFSLWDTTRKICSTGHLSRRESRYMSDPLLVVSI